jgi:magnesium transporter
MLHAFRLTDRRLLDLPEAQDLSEATWIDALRPDASEIAAVERLGFNVPTLEEMQEIEISNRLYRTGDIEVLTVSLPGQETDGQRVMGPVAFLLSPERLLTVRYHMPRPFETYPDHAESSAAGCATHHHVFLGLIEEIVARIADLIEGAGRGVDEAARTLFDDATEPEDVLEAMLRMVGRRGEELANYRYALLTLDRALTTFSLNLPEVVGQGEKTGGLRAVLEALARDMGALVEHADFLTARVAHVTDVVLGMVNLEQSDANRTFSIVAVLFLPPTLVASIYGMNVSGLPGMGGPYGGWIAGGAMIASAVGTYLYFRWKDWL